ncbi:hypothetical protein L7F22_007792 [Adiantum nelumboides]|nr:hypothetical protein [Adiantum nelumboides]
MNTQQNANVAENLSANRMQTMTVQSLREFMAMGTSFRNTSLASDPSLSVNDLQQPYSMINEGHAYPGHLNMDPKLNSSIYANSFNLMGDEPVVTPSSCVGTIGGTPLPTSMGCSSPTTMNAARLLEHPSLMLQNLSNQLYNSAASEMMVSASTDQRIPYRTQLQRESHILAERQRREEMNEKFTILRSMIPKLTKKDKASIVTDTINYIKELEKKVSYLQACKKKSTTTTPPLDNLPTSSSKPGLLGPALCVSTFGRCLSTNETLEARQKIMERVNHSADNIEEPPFLSINNGEAFVPHEGYGVCLFI